MNKEIAGIYRPEANVGNFPFTSCLLAYLRFLEVEFSNFITKIKRLLSKMVSSKFLYMSG